MIRFINIMHLAGDKELYSGLNWHIKPGDRTGLVGDNGTGKTTLLRMAAGDIEPTQGEVVPRKGARIGFLRQEIHMAEGDTTVIQEAMRAWTAQQAEIERLHSLYETVGHLPEEEQEAVYDEIHEMEKTIRHYDDGSAESDARKILTGLGFSLEQQDSPLSRFSGGWQMRAHIARLLLEQPDVLMLDEPTNHLDLESINWLEEFLVTFPGALVVVSHDRYFLDRITTSTAWVHEKRLDTYSYNYSGFLEYRSEHDEMLVRRHKNQQDEIAHIEQFIDRFRYKASKAAAVQSRIKMLDKIERVELPQSAKRVRLRIPTPAPCGKHILQLEDVGKAYGDNRVLQGVNLRFELGDKVALVGRNGAGKSTLLKIIAGVLEHEGVVRKDSKCRTEYFSQHRVDGLNVNNDVLTEARPQNRTHTDEQIRTLLGCFLFTGDDVFKPVHILSGGEKSRLAFSRMMLRQGNLLLLDEPTNHLDINTREVLQQALREFPGTVILISHDRYFIDQVVTHVIEVADRNAKPFHGNYSQWLKTRQESEDESAALRGRSNGSKPASSNSSITMPTVNMTDAMDAVRAIPAVDRKPQASRKQSAEERREKAQVRDKLSKELRKLETLISKHEARLAELHALEADPDAWATGRVTPELAAEARELEKTLPEHIEKWETVGQELESLKN